MKPAISSDYRGYLVSTWTVVSSGGFKDAHSWWASTREAHNWLSCLPLSPDQKGQMLWSCLPPGQNVPSLKEGLFSLSLVARISALTTTGPGTVPVQNAKKTGSYMMHMHLLIPAGNVSEHEKKEDFSHPVLIHKLWRDRILIKTCMKRMFQALFDENGLIIFMLNMSLNLAYFRRARINFNGSLRKSLQAWIIISAFL